ncbi:MAG TPA: O-acetyl-ADP-ribose deacetylase [Polyangiaceae bacterium]
MRPAPPRSGSNTPVNLGPEVDDSASRALQRGIEVVVADITTLSVDAIVNAANSSLLGGGGVDGAIHRASGMQLIEACRAIPELEPGVRCPTGEARITSGFRLPARFVIHTVGPVWQGGKNGEPMLLASAYRNCLALAAQHGLRSIAFPAISTGVYGYPPDLAAQIAVQEIRRGLEQWRAIERVLLVAFGEAAAQALRAAVNTEQHAS